MSELPDVMCQALARHWHGPDADIYAMEGENDCLDEARIQIAAIVQAGYVIVERERLTTLIELGRAADAMNECSDAECIKELADIVRQLAYVAGQRGFLDTDGRTR